MRDFTHEAYQAYLEAIKKSYRSVIRFDEYFSSDPKPGQFCMIKHDVDRRPYHALRMALLENVLGVKATYYFRVKPHTYFPNLMKQIHRLGHEIGYHYESLSDAQGDVGAAMKDFHASLKKFRAVVPVRTTAFHGRPLSCHDNRILFRLIRQQEAFFRTLDLLGDANEDIDYSDILYIGDTGRNWFAEKYNLRDRVASNLRSEFRNRSELLTYLKEEPHPRMIFQIHPERWSHNQIDWFLQLMRDTCTNALKALIAYRKASITLSGR